MYVTDKQNSVDSNVTFCGISSESTLFAPVPVWGNTVNPEIFVRISFS